MLKRALVRYTVNVGIHEKVEDVEEDEKEEVL